MAKEKLLAELELELDILQDERKKTKVGSIDGRWVAVVLVLVTIYFLATSELLITGSLIGVAVILLVISQRNLLAKDKVASLDQEIAAIQEKNTSLKEKR
ncbi:MAG: hypothetical protein DWQ07_02025 [Chloroflexi bacterium]|nr:MAG: hypothetical protein DWQ07_02025 [Chloroflexota bacterium]MBL1193724.1 hypothetical protein [Chloroflexota bacterium]NOH11017.1 hypothetical protein [Chloroflexota bacterium]